jgi:trehalose synthase
MLKKVKLKNKQFSDYRSTTDPLVYKEVLDLAVRLKNKRVLHINATSAGGGVAEILNSEVPLMVDLGIKAEWHVLEADQDFFEITKLIHNGLQGQTTNLTLGQWDAYLDYNKRLSAEIQSDEWDYIIIHDPQPAAVLSYIKNQGKTKWIWRCHIDSRHATSDFIHHFNIYLRPYNGMIFTMMKYLFGSLSSSNLAIIPMAIDPLSDKNRPTERQEALARVKRFGIDITKPIALQVSRFDPWKDPLGVITAWQLAKAQIPDLQLVLAGNTSVDDPEGARIYQQVCQAAHGINDLFILANQADDLDINALQYVADVVIQKSIREGFGLTVAEALWAGTPVIGTNVGGIPEQIQNNISGFIVKDSDELAQRLTELIRNPKKAKIMGTAGHNFVQKHFLLPRLLRDDLNFFANL